MRRLRLAALACVAALSLTGCGGLLGGGVDNLPLPGGADLGSHPITITADFDDVLDLVPQSSVKVDNVAVGRVSKIVLNPDDHTAHVSLKINGSVDLPVGTTARLAQTTLLGEKYVALIRPTATDSAPVLMASGANLGLADTSQAADVEEVLGALSMLLNGGGIGQFQQISRELQKVSTGRPGEIKTFLVQMSSFVTQLDNNKASLTTALDSLARLSTTLDGDKATIAKALKELSPGMQVIVDQRKQLVAMLKSLHRLSTVTVSTLNSAQDDMVADFKALKPILRQLAKSGADLPNSLQILLTYPFPDSVLGAIKGDYLNVFITTNFRTVPNNCKAMGCAWPQVAGRVVMGSSAAFGARVVAPTPMLLPSTSSPMPSAPGPTLSVPSSSQSPSLRPGSPSSGSPGSAVPSGSAPPSPTASSSSGSGHHSGGPDPSAAPTGEH